jgi:hypothetical protein
MKITLKKFHSVDTATIGDLRLVVQNKAQYFATKYENTFSGKLFDKSRATFYRRCKDTYYDLFAVLDHLYRFNRLVDDVHCMSCKFTPGHSVKLIEDFKKHYALIMKCRDGFHFTNELKQ